MRLNFLALFPLTMASLVGSTGATEDECDTGDCADDTAMGMAAY